MRSVVSGFVVGVRSLGPLSKSPIDLRFDDGLLTIEAVHEVADEERTRSRRIFEELRVPGDVLVEDIEADYHNGVLEVRIPAESTPEDRGHRIDVN